MANEYLVAKWKLWYTSLDVNHDGKISIEDVEESRAKFSELSKLDAEKSKLVEENFTKWWNEFVFRGQTGEIEMQQFVDALSKDLASDKAKFHDDMKRCFNIFFDVIDTNKDRSISEAEFLIAFQAYGHENVAADKNFFKSYTPEKEGDEMVVKLQKIVDSWVDFVIGEDASGLGDIVKKAFEAGA